MAPAGRQGRTLSRLSTGTAAWSFSSVMPGFMSGIPPRQALRLTIGMAGPSPAMTWENSLRSHAGRFDGDGTQRTARRSRSRAAILALLLARKREISVRPRLRQSTLSSWWGREMSHVGLDQILTQGAGRNGRFEAKQGFGIYPNPSLPRLGRGGRRFKILPLRPPHPTLSAAVTASPKANRGARLPTSRA